MTLDTHAMLLLNAEVPPAKRFIEFTRGDSDLEALLIRQRDKTLKAAQDWLQGLHEDAKAGGHWDAGTLWYLSREIRGSLMRSRQPQEASDKRGET